VREEEGKGGVAFGVKGEGFFKKEHCRVEEKIIWS